MAGKSWQPSHRPPQGRGKGQAPVTDKTVEREREMVGEAYAKSSKLNTTLMFKKLMLMPNATNSNAHAKCYNVLSPRARGILVHAHISKCH